MKHSRLCIALTGILIAGCTTKPDTPPRPHRWASAGSMERGFRMEFDRATLEVHGPVARVWMRDFGVDQSEPSRIYQEEFDCVRGKRRTLQEAWRAPSGQMGPLRTGSGGPGPGWKEGMWVPNGGPGNWWGRTLLYVCRAAGMPELSRDSVLP